MFANKIYSVFLIALLYLSRDILHAQEPVQLNTPILRTSISAESGFLSYKGDEAESRFSANNTNIGFAFNLHYSYWRVSFNASSASLTWNEQSNLSRSNFQCSMKNAGILAGRFLFNTNEGKRFNPYAMIGISTLRSNTQTDLLDQNGIAYQYWSDGTIHAVSEVNGDDAESSLIKRDYTYETPLALNQTSMCFPIELGISASISPRTSIEVSWKNLLLQSDNIDANTSNARWDNIQQINMKVTYALFKKVKQPKLIAPPSLINYKNVDLRALMNEDEDADGVVDSKDKCFGTPKGASIDKNGCMLDMDSDGIPDYIDKQNDTQAGSWVDEQGIAQSDAWIKEHYRDSSSYFVQVLRKINRNSRPFPIRKYIPKENLQRWIELLDEHPEWRTRSEISGDKFPSDLKIIDSNNDHYISLKELQQATNKLFDGDKSLNEELLNKAMNYAFNEQ
jgi:hypothetical protein